MRLTAMMNLVLEQMKQQPVHPLVLNVISAIDVDDPVEIGPTQLLNDRNQAPVHLALRLAEQDRGFARFAVGPGRRSKRAALHGVDVEAIDDQDVIERRAQTWKEA